MAWTTPSLRAVREMVRNDVSASVTSAVLIGNSVLRVMSDAMAGLTHLTLRYIDWLARQLLPDTAEREWLDRHGNIWLVNADASTGRKTSSYAEGVFTFTGIQGFVIPIATPLNAFGVRYETTEEITIGAGATNGAVRAIDPGAIGNLDVGSSAAFTASVPGIDGAVVVVSMDGGADDETDDELRSRVLFRIQKPPMGGDADDYIRWALAVSGVTRAWSFPQEMGIGTMTVRFMADDLRVSDGGIPQQVDIDAVTAYLNTVRPVTVKDLFIEAPILFPYNLTISGLLTDDSGVRARIEASVRAMEKVRFYPGVTVYRSWVDEAISAAVGEDHHELTFSTLHMSAPGYLPVLGTISYA